MTNDTNEITPQKLLVIHDFLELFPPAESQGAAAIELTTVEFLQRMELMIGKIEGLDASILYSLMKETGYRIIIEPGTKDFKWLIAEINSIAP